MLAELRLRPGRVAILPNTFDAEYFSPAAKPRYLLKRFGLKPNQPIILTVARLASNERYKGYDQVLCALPAIRRAIPSVHYIIGGRGPDRSRVEALVRRLNLMDTVTLAGYVPDHELCDFYNLCDVFAMPSKREGFGIVFLEALACGKPVLAGNRDGSVDALLDGEFGVLVNPDNVAEIAGSLTAILAGKHPLAILHEPEKLRAKVIATYGYEQFVRRMRRHLEELGLLPAVREDW
jgi:glycosyltransferase involved in cell wall biosynthesis